MNWMGSYLVGLKLWVLITLSLLILLLFLSAIFYFTTRANKVKLVSPVDSPSIDSPLTFLDDSDLGSFRFDSFRRPTRADSWKSVDLSTPLTGLPYSSFLGCGHWFAFREIEVATRGFSKENVLGEGGYGVVYKGELVNGTKVAVKNLLNNM